MIMTTTAGAQNIGLNQSFDHDTIISPFTCSAPVWSLKMTGGIKLFSDSSLVRVVLQDDAGTDHLVYEAYPLITATPFFSVPEGCDETRYLEGVTAGRLRIDIIDALATIDSLFIDTNYIANIRELQVASKRATDSVKVVIMNQRIAEEKMYWRAGRSSFTDKMFDEKEKTLGTKYNLLGLDYYKGGLYQPISNKVYYPSTNQLVADFDWKYRHGADNPGSPYFDSDTSLQKSGWLTESRDQSGCATCFVYGPSGSVEARLNLFYNMHDKNNHQHADVNLSEQDVWKCPVQHGNWLTGGIAYTSFEKMKTGFRCQESDYPYQCNADTLCEKPVSLTNPQVKIENFYQTHPYLTEDSMKMHLITKRPVTARIPLFFDPGAGTIGPHYVVLTGFEYISLGDTVYHGSGPDDADIVIDSTSELIGNTRWHFKNSWGKSYGLSGFSTDNLSILYTSIDKNFCYVPTGKVFWENHDPVTDVVCTDEDGDGYYWWGLGPKPPTCPAQSSDEEDCDDNDPLLGPYNLQGQQPLYECSDICFTLSDSLVVPPGFPAITNDYHLQKDLVIPSGVTLTINANVWISQGVEIRVYGNGILKLDSNARLTGSCNQLWDGIRLYGTTEPQSTTGQGRVIIKGGVVNKPVIEHAMYGIKTMISSGAYGGGGIVRAKNAVFRNNRTALYFSGYAGEIDSSVFIQCTFEADSSLIDQSRPERLVMLSDLPSNHCLRFEGCTFRQLSGSMDLLAIRAHNAWFKSKNLETITPPAATSFSNLQYGIYSTSDLMPGTPFNVEGCDFTANYRCIYASAIDAAHVLSNNFNIPLLGSPEAPLYGFTSYGLYLDHCNTYHVKNNNFISDSYGDQIPPPGYVATCGVFINNSGPNENEIYRNTFEELHCAFAAYGENRSGQGPGLKVKCNTFSDNGMDIGVFKGSLQLTGNMGIKYAQGEYDAQNDSSSAGNVFTSDSSFHTWDILNYTNQIQYNHHRTQSTTLKVKPDDDKILNSEPNQNVESDYSPLSCPSHLNNDEIESEDSLKNRLAFSKDQIFSISEEISALADGGQTDSLLQAIYFSIPAQALDVYSVLLEQSPYISDTVMKLAIDREDILQNAMIRDIMVANPHASKKDSILDAIDNRFIPMPDSLYADILQGLTMADAMDSLQDALLGHSVAYGKSFNSLINIYLHDTLSSFINDSITELLQLDIRLSSKYSLALRLLDQGNIAGGDLLISGIPSSYNLNSLQSQEYDLFHRFFNCKKRAILNAGTMTFDSLQLQQLNGIIELDTTYRFVPTVLARNILQSKELLLYQEPLVFDSYVKSLGVKKKRHFDEPSSSEYLKIWPNPAKDYLIIEYNAKQVKVKPTLIVTNVNGLIYDQLLMEKSQDQIVYISRNLPAGTFVLSLFSAGKKLESQKFIVVH